MRNLKLSDVGINVRDAIKVGTLLIAATGAVMSVQFRLDAIEERYVDQRERSAELEDQTLQRLETMQERRQRMESRINSRIGRVHSDVREIREVLNNLTTDQAVFTPHYWEAGHERDPGT